MARNVELKARVDDLEPVRLAAAGIAEFGPYAMTQDDTFFACASGRLKLRSFSAEEGELIFYRRDEEKGPKESYYLRADVAAPTALHDLLSAAYGRAGRVRKKRTVFLVGRVRIHLDEVEDLGTFIELEVVLDDGDAVEDGVAEARSILGLLGVDESGLLESAYVDLIEGELG